jgi:hypothetical protein
MRSLIVGSALSVLTCMVVSPALAGTLESAPGLLSALPRHDPWRVNWLPVVSEETVATSTVPPLLLHPAVQEQAGAQPVHAAAVEHSDAYQTRAKIHKFASFATIPLFATELALGQSLYNNTDRGWKKGMHGAVGAGIVGLFGVNTILGSWNLFGEGWQDKGRGLRLLHGLLMMAADAGFVATSMSTPSRHRILTFQADQSTHRNLALASIGVGTTGYLVMLLGSH